MGMKHNIYDLEIGSDQFFKNKFHKNYAILMQNVTLINNVLTYYYYYKFYTVSNSVAFSATKSHKTNKRK